MSYHDQHRSEEDETVTAARDWVVTLTSGEPTAEDIQRFEVWLAQSPLHQDAFEKEQRFWQSLGGLKAASGPRTWGQVDSSTESAGARKARHIGRGALSHHRVPRRRLMLAGSAAAACVVFFLVFGGWLGAVLSADYRTTQGELITATLPDGSVVHLNTDTALAVTYNDVERRIDLLHGEALFDVHSDRDRPFRVVAADGVTEAVGTAFVVRRDKGTTSVTVTEGRVSVTSPANTSAGTAIALAVKQGQRTRYPSGGPPQPAEAFDPANAAPWLQNLIVIDDLPLAGALAELDRYRPGRIVLMPGRADYTSVSGAFDVNNIDAAIAAIAATHDLSVTEITPYLLVLR